MDAFGADNVADPGAPAPAPPPGERRGFFGVSRRKAAQEDARRGGKAPLTLEERNRMRHEEMEVAAEIQDIQEIDDAGAGDLTRRVAAPGRNLAPRVEGLDELKDETGLLLPDTGLDGVDLTMLTRVLAPVGLVYEEDLDEVWDHGTLLTQVASEVTAERERMAAAAAAAAGRGAA